MKLFVLTPCIYRKVYCNFVGIKLAFIEFGNIISKLSIIKNPYGHNII